MGSSMMTGYSLIISLCILDKVSVEFLAGW